MPEDELEALLLERYLSREKRKEIDRQISSKYLGKFAVLVIDSSGFTRITETHGIIHFLSIIAMMRHIVRKKLLDNKVDYYWFEADNAYAIFTTAESAYASAVAIQKEIAAHNRKVSSDDKLGLCIGIGYGPLLRISEKHIYGQEMNVVSKLGEDIAEPGEILLTKGIFDALSKVGTNLRGEWRSQQISGVQISYFMAIY